MRTHLGIALSLTLAAVTGLAGHALAQNGKKEIKPSNRCIALVNAGAVSAEVLEQIRGHLENNLQVRVRAVNAGAGESDDLLIQLRAWKTLMTPDDVCFIALANSAKDVREYLLVAPDHRWAMVIPSAVLPEDGDANKHLWRLQRLCMRGAGFLVGLGFSANPHSVNSTYLRLDELDRMGTNFDPPTQEQFLINAKERGLDEYIKIPERRKRPAAQSEGKAPAEAAAPASP